MIGFFIRWVVCALGLWLAERIVPGMWIQDTETLFLAALLLGLVNAIVRPVAVFLTFPLTIVSLGIFLLVVNAGMLGLVALLLDGFQLAGFGPAFVGSVIVSLTSWMASWYVGPRGRVEVMVRRRSY